MTKAQLQLKRQMKRWKMLRYPMAWRQFRARWRFKRFFWEVGWDD